MDDPKVVRDVSRQPSGMSRDTTEVQPRAFEPFYTTKDVGEGTGLGLDISRRIIVGRHHGQISIQRPPGETVLSIRLPRHL
jgi:signal transduction histidine kinase